MTQTSTPGQPVLLVDDDGDICTVIKETLQARGYETVCVTSDREAHEILGAGRSFAALIVDINLGTGTTGYDVARFARRQAPSLPVLYISGQSPASSFKTFGVRGSMFLEKPFTPETLAAHVGALIDLGVRR